ncbi:MAG: flagellar hook-associated protein [Beijerinckiaceae bacterium]|nr:MAG: flagellar hook-associated protein [Beijerinckiaceae bacterium]
MTILMNDATNANVSILQRTNELFQLTQKRVATGKSVFGAADDTTRYKMSETMLGRGRQLSDINNNISLALSTLEATDKTLKNMVGLIESGQTLIRKAQSEGAAGLRSVTPTANLNSSSVVTGVTVGSKFSVTSDAGKNFTYTFNSTTVTWGQVADALNSANIGVLAEFVPSTTANQTNLRFVSFNEKDFTFDAITDENVMDDLTGLTSPNGQVFSPADLFANGILPPAANERGFTVSYGGQVTGTAGAGVTGATAIAAGTTLTFEDGTGGVRSISYAAASTLNQVITDITAMGAGIKAELVNVTGAPAGPLQFRMRNMNGGDMKILSGTGSFAAAAAIGFPGVTVGYAAPLSSNNALRLAYGRQYDAIIVNLDLLVQNNPVQNGRNLLQGQNMNVVMDEFAGNPLTISGISITAAGTLTLSQAGSGWTTDQNIQNSATQANQALINLRNFQAQFATFNSYIKSRYDLNKAYQGDMKTQGDELVAADASEESANLVALQTRQQFAVQALTIGNQNEQSLLRLLG